MKRRSITIKTIEFPFQVPEGEFYYLAGPMSFRAHIDHNIPAFEEAARRLRKADYNICTPDELDRNRDSIDKHFTPGGIDALRADASICMYPLCVGVICLPGWEQSFGAGQIEVYLADRFRKHTTEITILDDDPDGFMLRTFNYDERMEDARLEADLDAAFPKAAAVGTEV